MKNTANNPDTNSSEPSTAITLLIIDESGSMSSIAQSAVDTHNRIVTQLAAECETLPDLKQYINAYTFEGRNIIERVPLQLVQPDTVTALYYVPKGLTPLYDAIGTAVTQLEQRILEDPQLGNDTRVSVAIITDGLENSSKEFSHPEILRLITRLKSVGWEFTYYGADHDVEKVARSINIGDSRQFRKTAEDMEETASHFSRKEFVSKSQWMKEMEEKKRR